MGRNPRQKPLLTKNNRKACLTFVKKNSIIPKVCVPLHLFVYNCIYLGYLCNINIVKYAKKKKKKRK